MLRRSAPQQRGGLRCSEPEWRTPVASGTPRHSPLRRSVARSSFPGVSIKNFDFLGLDRPRSRDIKGKQFRGKRGGFGGRLNTRRDA